MCYAAGAFGELRSGELHGPYFAYTLADDANLCSCMHLVCKSG